jgi:hypothetical protein
MSVAVLCNLSDGVIIGVDSALTVMGANGVERVFEDGGKLFQIGKKLGVATFGLAGLGGRSIGSFLHEFEGTHPELEKMPIPEAVESLREFFFTKYKETVAEAYGKPFEEVTEVSWNTTGLVVVGYSPGSYLSEAWEIRIPDHTTPNSSRQVYAPGSFGLAWFALSDPIERYLYGISLKGLGEIADYMKELLGRDITADEFGKLIEIRNGQAYQIMTDSMPVKTGIAYVRDLVNHVIAHYRFTEPHPTVGGKAQIGVITYRGEEFEISE